MSGDVPGAPLRQPELRHRPARREGRGLAAAGAAGPCPPLPPGDTAGEPRSARGADPWGWLQGDLGGVTAALGELQAAGGG